MVSAAREIAQKSMAAVKARDKAAWLALWAEDGWVEDPIGKSFIDPTGLGHHGPAAREAFWENNIGSTESVSFDLKDSFACGDEVANVATITITLPGGAVSLCEGVFVYRVNDEGKLLSLRAYWELDRMMATMSTPAS
jgi:ketosteroid isomerase-like protein